LGGGKKEESDGGKAWNEKVKRVRKERKKKKPVKEIIEKYKTTALWLSRIQ